MLRDRHGRGAAARRARGLGVLRAGAERRRGRAGLLRERAAAPAPEDREKEEDPEEKEKAPGAPHVLVVRTPEERLTWLQAIRSRRKADVAAGIPGLFAGALITDGYTGYQHLLPRLAGIQQCCAHYADTVVMPIRELWRWRAGAGGLAVSA